MGVLPAGEGHSPELLNSAQHWKHLYPPLTSLWLICCSSVHDLEPRVLYNVLVMWTDTAIKCAHQRGMESTEPKKKNTGNIETRQQNGTKQTPHQELGLHCSKRPFSPWQDWGEVSNLWYETCKEAKYFKSTNVRFLSVNTHLTCKKNPFLKPCNEIPRQKSRHFQTNSVLKHL